jgi:hypothetical protein
MDTLLFAEGLMAASYSESKIEKVISRLGEIITLNPGGMTGFKIADLTFVGLYKFKRKSLS